MLETEVTAEWGDCDPAGIVFYPSYFRWMDAAFQGLLRGRGLSQAAITDRFGAVTPLVDAGASFRAPVRPGDAMRVAVGVTEWLERRFVLAYAFSVGGRAVVEGRETRAWALLEGDRLKGAPIDPEFRRLLG